MATLTQSFEVRSERLELVIAAVQQASAPRPGQGQGQGVVFLTGKVAAQAGLIASRLAEKRLNTDWLIVCGVGALSEHGEIEGESGAAGLRLPVPSEVVMGERPDRSFGAALTEHLVARAGSSACVFVRGEMHEDEWLEYARTALGERQVRVFGGGSLPGHLLYLVVSGRVVSGAAAGLILKGPTVSRLFASSACRLLSPVGMVTQSRGVVIEEIDGYSALKRLSECTHGLQEQSLVLLAIAGGERPLDPAGRSLALTPIVGVDPTRGTILIAEELPQGARVAFAVRDARGARSDFEAQLRGLRARAAGTAPGFGIYVSCAGRGRALYKSPDVDTRVIASQFPHMPFVGLHSTFEIAPLGDRLAAQVYAGVLAVFSQPS